MTKSIDFHENHQQGEGGEELSEQEQKKQEEATEKRVQEAEEDPEVLANPTEIRQGGSTGNLTGS